MLRTGEQYRDSIRDGRQVWINGERVKDVTTHPSFKPIVDLRARLYDMAHEAKHREAMSYIDPVSNEPCNLALKLPKTQQDWHDKRRYVDAQLNEIGGLVGPVGDENNGDVGTLHDDKAGHTDAVSKISAPAERPLPYTL